MTEESKSKLMTKPVISSRLPDAFYYSAKEAKRKKTRASKPEDPEVSKALKLLSKLPANSLTPPSSLHLNELVTIEQLSEDMERNRVSKSLDAFTLKLYIVTSVPIQLREDGLLLKDKISNWRRHQVQSESLVNIKAKFWNNPEGCITVATEHTGGLGLPELIQKVGSVPECILAHIAKRVLQCFYSLQANSLGNYSVLFDRRGKVKLGVSLTDLWEPLQDPLYQLGYFILWAGLGEHEALESALQGPCCLFHSLDPNPITHRFTAQFKEFLCICLRAEAVASPEQMLKLQWFALRDYPGPELSIKDLLDMGNSRHSHRAIEDLENLCSKISLVINGRKVQAPSEAAVQNFAEEIGAPVDMAFEYIQRVFSG